MKKILLLTLLSAPLFAPNDTVFKNILRGTRRANTQIVRGIVTASDAQPSIVAQPTNGDEQLYPDKRASFGKTLNQLASGLIDPVAFAQMTLAITTGNQSDFNAITMGTNPVVGKLVEPQAFFTYNLNATDHWLYAMLPPPTLASDTMAGELVELYWMALLRDVPFSQYATNATAAAAIADLNNLPSFNGPTPVTAQNLFRSNIAGTQTGPYISQFLYLAIPTGSNSNVTVYPGTAGVNYQAQPVPAAGISNDFMYTFATWHSIQQGNKPPVAVSFITPTLWFIRDGRDLGQYVHDCYDMQPFINAATIINSWGAAALDPSNPYIGNPTQASFVTYSFADVINLTSMAAQYALRAAWYQKWMVHRRLRPEFFGFLVNQQKTDVEDFGINDAVINSQAITEIFNMYGSYYLPQAFAEGSPAHPSYPQGHSSVAGACATILKAFYNENYLIQNSTLSYQPDSMNSLGSLTLVQYTGTPLTLGGELNKLAFNTSVGRDHAGVHYRSDCEQGLYLGEAVAISILQDEAYTRPVPFKGFSLTKFDGTTVVIGAKQSVKTIG